MSECENRRLDETGLSEDHEIRRWAEKLGVSEDELREAVDKVGENAEAVRAYLATGRSLSGRPAPGDEIG